MLVTAQFAFLGALSFAVFVLDRGTFRHGYTLSNCGQFVFYGQVYLLALWGALGPGTAVKRLTLSFLVGVLLCFVASLGDWFQLLEARRVVGNNGVILPPSWLSWIRSLTQSMVLFMWGEMVVMAYLVYRWRGWRIQHRGDDQPIVLRKSIQFGIRHLMVLTAFVAVLALLVRPMWESLGSNFGFYHPAVFAFVLAIIILPMTSALLRDHCHAAMVTGIAIWTFVIPGVHCLLALPFRGSSIFLEHGLPYFSVIAVYFGTLLVLRTLGWRLVRPIAPLPISIEATVSE